MEANNLRDDKVKRLRLLLHGGSDIQLLYDTLPEAQLGDESCSYDNLMRAIEHHLNRPILKVYERETLRSMKKQPNEKVDEFVVRLRQQAAKCGLAPDFQEIMIIDQLIENCQEVEMRSRLMTKDFILFELIDIARQVEFEVEKKKKSEKARFAENINDIKVENRRPSRTRFENNSNDQRTCFNCGRSGHLASAESCPARGKKCNKCQRIGHFENTCRKRKNEAPNNQFRKRSQVTTALVEEEKYVFYTGGEYQMNCIIGGVPIEMLIDSGSDANIIGQQDWEHLKGRKIKVYEQSSSSSRIFKGYANQEQLCILGEFKAVVSINGKEIYDNFYVIKNGQRSLLGREAAQKLGVLKIGFDVNEVKEDKGEMKRRGKVVCKLKRNFL